MGERRLIKLGQEMAALQDRAPEARLDRAQGRARLLAAEIPVPRRSGRRFPVALALAASLAAFLVALVVLLARPRDPLSFELGTPDPGQVGGDPGVVGAWIAAPANAGRPIRFSDGSLLQLAPGARARVTALAADGAEIALERGTLEVSVVHRAHTRWKLRVGPFQVHVIGTRFDLAWEPLTEQLDVALREGAITVSGPIVGEGRAVRAGERLTISTTRSTLEVSAIDGARADVAPPGEPTGPRASLPPPGEAPGGERPRAFPDNAGLPPPRAPAPSAVTPSGEPPPPSSATAATPPAEADPSTPTAAPAPLPAPEASAQPATGWRALALNARYKDALAAAELEGFDAICGSAGVGDLQSLSYAARLGGSGARAVQALTVLRRRFPGTAEAGAAAFMLGRMAQDGAHDQAGAASWFNRYLSEQPSGAFAADAAGRLVEAADKMGDDAGARRAATRYLTLYPSGPHAAYARGVLARGASAPPSPTP